MMDFGEALKAVKSGKKITREGWNGKGLFVVYQKVQEWKVNYVINIITRFYSWRTR